MIRARGVIVPARYPNRTMSQVAATGTAALMARRFVVAHELAHLARYMRGVRVDGVAEELEADEEGWQSHHAAGLMMLPPYCEMVRAGQLTSARECRELDEKEGLTRFRRLSKAEMNVASHINHWIFAGPFVMFGFLERVEYAHERIGRPMLRCAPSCVGPGCPLVSLDAACAPNCNSHSRRSGLGTDLPQVLLVTGCVDGPS